MPLTEDEVREWAMNNLGDDGYKDMCQRIAEKPVPVKKKHRNMQRSHQGRLLEKPLPQLRQILQETLILGKSSE